MLRTASRLVPRLALVAGSVAVGAAVAAALRADLMVGYGVSKALERRQSASEFVAARPARRLAKQSTGRHWKGKPEVGDEVYWLTGGGDTPAATPVVLGDRLTVGSRIAITGQDGRTRRLEVVDLTPVGASLHNVAHAPVLGRLVRVTCRVVGPAAAAGKPELVRFYIEAEAARPATLPAEGDPPERLRQG